MSSRTTPHKFNKEEGLKEAILILASATVQNGAAHGQPRRGACTERSEEILRCAGLSSFGCHEVFHRPAFGSTVRTARAMVDSMLLDRIDGVTRLMKSLLFHAHGWVGVSRLPRGSPSTASKSITGTTLLACVHGVDAMYASGVQCETRASSTVFTEVEQVSHSQCASVSSLASKYWRSIPSNLPFAICWIPQSSARQSSVLGSCWRKRNHG